MSKKVPSLAALVNAIVAHHGFSVHLVPLEAIVAAEIRQAPAAKPPTTLAQRTAAIGDDAKAPHGRDSDGNPLAPHGWLADGSRPRKSPAGRPPVAKPAAAPAAPTTVRPAPTPPLTFSLDLSDLGGAPATHRTTAPVATAAGVLDELEMDLGPLG